MKRTKPKLRLTQAERVAMSDEKMIQAAIELILDVGTDKTTLKDVSERAGYSRSLAGVRFGTKEELFKRVLEEHRKLWFGTLRECTDEKIGMEAILTRIDAVEQVLTMNPDNIRAMYTLWFDSLGHPSVLRKELEQYNKQSRTEMTALLTAGIKSGEFPADLDIKQFVIDYYARIYGLIYQWLVSPEAVDLAHSFRSLKSFCQMILATGRAKKTRASTT